MTIRFPLFSPQNMAYASQILSVYPYLLFCISYFSNESPKRALRMIQRPLPAEKIAIIAKIYS